MKFIFDESNLKETAEAVIRINSFTKEFTVQGLIDHMKITAQDFFTYNLGYISTYGYVLNAYRDENGDVGIKASVSSYTVLEYMKHCS